MRNAANVAVLTAKQCYKINLNYSDDSVEKVEQALCKIHEEYLSSKNKNQEGLHGLSIMFGAYIGEVLKKEKGVGYWGKDHPVFGKNCFPLYWNDNDCAFPVDWCLKRIINGPEDNVVHKYKILTKGKTNT